VFFGPARNASTQGVDVGEGATSVRRLQPSIGKPCRSSQFDYAARPLRRSDGNVSKTMRPDWGQSCCIRRIAGPRERATTAMDAASPTRNCGGDGRITAGMDHTDIRGRSTRVRVGPVARCSTSTCSNWCAATFGQGRQMRWANSLENCGSVPGSEVSRGRLRCRLDAKITRPHKYALRRALERCPEACAQRAEMGCPVPDRIGCRAPAAGVGA